MLERFTAQARQVIVLAQEEARALKHNNIGTGHILLGLLSDDHGVAARILHDDDTDCEHMRNNVVAALSGPAGQEEPAYALETDPPSLSELPNHELKTQIRQLNAEEEFVSYERRILHAKIDILRAELVARLKRQHEDGEGIWP